MMRLVILCVAIIASAMAESHGDHAADMCTEEKAMKCGKPLKDLMAKNETNPKVFCPILERVMPCIVMLEDCKNQTIAKHAEEVMGKIKDHYSHCKDEDKHHHDSCTKENFEHCMSIGGDMHHGDDDKKGGDHMSGDGGYGDKGGDHMSGDGGYGDKGDGYGDKGDGYGKHDDNDSKDKDDMFEKWRKMEEMKKMCRMGHAKKMCFQKMAMNCSNEATKMALETTVYAIGYNLKKECEGIIGCTEKRRLDCMEGLHRAHNQKQKCGMMKEAMHCLKELIDEDCHDKDEYMLVKKMALPMLEREMSYCGHGGDGDGDGPSGAASVGVMLPVVSVMSVIAKLFN